MVMYWICIMHVFSGLRMYWICNQNVLDSLVCVLKMYSPTLMIPIHCSMKSIQKSLRPALHHQQCLEQPIHTHPKTTGSQALPWSWAGQMELWASMMSYDWSVIDDVTSKYSCNPACREQTYNQLDQILETSCQVDVLVNPARCERAIGGRKGQAWNKIT